MTFDVQSATASRPIRSDYQADTGSDPALTSSSAVPAGNYQLEPGYHPQLGSLLGLAAFNGNRAAADVSFETQVAGRDSQAIDLELMQISNAVYDPAVTQVGQWSRVSDADLMAAGIDPALFETPETGFRAGLYRNGEGQYVLAFAGSNERIDWTDANLVQGLGWNAEQYDQAATLAQLVDNSAFGGGNFVITGHSLGGGLAATAALVSDTTAVTFNASGVHDNTLERLGLDPAQARLDSQQGQIRRYNISGDPLTGAQEDVWGSRSLMPDAPGHEINLQDPYPAVPGPDLTDWPWKVADNIIEYGKAKAERAGALHGQQGVLDALEQQRPWQ